MISRFLLDLRQLDDFSETDDDRPSAPIAFSRRLTQDDARTSDLGGMLGNMGENLHCPFDKVVEDRSPPEEHVMDKAQSFLSESFEKAVIVCEVEVVRSSHLSSTYSMCSYINLLFVPRYDRFHIARFLRNRLYVTNGHRKASCYVFPKRYVLPSIAGSR